MSESEDNESVEEETDDEGGEEVAEEPTNKEEGGENEEGEKEGRKCACGFEREHFVNQGFLLDWQLAILRGPKQKGFCPIHPDRKLLDPKTALKSEKVHMNECPACRMEHDERGMRLD